MKRKLSKTIIVIIAVFIFTGAICYGITNISYFNITQVDVKNNGQVSKTSPEILRIIQPLKEQNVFSVNLKYLKNLILSVEGVSDVKISRWFPNKLFVEITYKTFNAKLKSDGQCYLAGNDSLMKVSYDVFNSFTEVSEVEIDPDYCIFLSKWGYDEGFFYAVSLVGAVESNLISYIKYDNNNGNGFGRLIFELKAIGAQLCVNEPVSSQRFYEALDILKKSVPDSSSDLVRYDLYSDSLIRRT